MPRKLKLYQTSLGFYDSVVAAPSQAAALRAWGTDTNLFREGLAEIATDPATIEAALAHPETPLRRPVGSTAPFSLKPKPPKASDIMPDEPEARRVRSRPKQKMASASQRPPPDRSKLEAAEAALARLDERHRREQADLDHRRRLLDRKEADLAHERRVLSEDEKRARARWEREKADAERAAERERRSYRSLGGRD